MKPFLESVKIKVFLGYFTLILLASLIIWVIYSDILLNSGEKVDFNPANNKFIYINSILTNLYQAEGLERNYAQTSQKTNYQYYLKLMDTISMQIDTLALMVNNSAQQIHTDSIKQLLLIKRQNLIELDDIKEKNSSKVRYQQAIKKISSLQDSKNKIQKSYKKLEANQDSIYKKQKKKNFFERFLNIFSARNKIDPKLQVSSNQPVEIDRQINTVNSSDTIAGFLSAMVTEIRDDNLAVETSLKQKEREILANDLIITFQLREMLSNIEKEELNSTFQKVEIQQSRIEKTTRLIIIVGSFALLTIVLFLVNILKDITKSQRYRQSLERAKAYSESLLKSKEQFILSLTHDLKSPLSSIIGFTGIMEVDDKVSPQHQKYLQNITKSSNHILKLINDLLDLARLESGKLTIEHLPFDLKLLIHDIVDGFRPQAQAKNIDLQLQYNISSSEFYRSDPVRINQVVSNLISNAIKFTEEGKVMVLVSAIAFSEKIDQIQIEVTDTGIGISEENIPMVFEEFTRVTTSEKQYEGTGLGLTITQKIINLLHGTINLESKPGEGSHFIIALPLEKSVQLQENAPIIIEEKGLNAKENIVGKKVWIIDDDQVLLEMTSIILRSIGMEVHSFNDPQKALHSFTKGCADLLIMDIQMPVINGVELLKQIQEKNGGKLTSIAISGMNARQNDFTGFSSFIQKPFHPQTLIDAISGQQQKITETDNQKNSPIVRQSGYSLEQFTAFASGDPENLRQILVSLIQSGRENTSLFRQYLEDKNIDALAELSHKMLTLFRQMEATDIVELLALLEQIDEHRLDNKQYFLLSRLAVEKIEALLETIQKVEKI